MIIDKAIRLLILFDRLSRNEVINKKIAAEEFDVSEKTIWRDIEEINEYIESELRYKARAIHYREYNGYRLNNPFESKLSKEETLTIVKVILESRAFSKPDMEVIVDKLINSLSRNDKKLLNSFFGNEKYHYIQTKNSKSLFEILWEFCVAIKGNRLIKATYIRNADKKTVNIELEPVSILFSEYYFYLIAYTHNENRPNPSAFRLDNFLSYTVTDTPHIRNHSIKNRFEEGELRKRVLFMTIGDLVIIEFEFWGRSIGAITDRLPTARIIEQNGDRTTFRAEVYGRGVKMWLLSQAQYLKVLKPPELVAEMKQTISLMLDNYS